MLTFSAHRKYNALIQPIMSTQKQFLFKLVTRQYIKRTHLPIKMSICKNLLFLIHYICGAKFQYTFILDDAKQNVL